MASIVTPDYVQRLMRDVLGGRLKDKPGKPAIDRRDIYLRLVKVVSIYPDEGIALIKPYKYMDDPMYEPFPAQYSYLGFDNNSLAYFLPRFSWQSEDEEGRRVIVPEDDLFALAMSVEGMPDEKGTYLLGFVKRSDHVLTSYDKPLQAGFTIEHLDARVRIIEEDRSPAIVLENGENKITLTKKGIYLSGKVYVNGKQLKTG